MFLSISIPLLVRILAISTRRRAGKSGRHGALPCLHPSPPSAARAGGPNTVARAGRRLFSARVVLLIAFAFAIMADAVSSVAYTIEASLRSLDGHLELLMATQVIVLGIILLVDVNYWQLASRPLPALGRVG